MGVSQRSRSLFVPYVVKVDDVVVMSGSGKSISEGRARMERRLMRQRGEKVKGRVKVEAVR